MWYGFWYRSVIGQYSFENARGDAVTVSGEHYREIISNYFWHKLQDICENNDDVDMVDLGVQQGDAMGHTAREGTVLRCVITENLYVISVAQPLPVDG